jgi:hypothetical protein
VPPPPFTAPPSVPLPSIVRRWAHAAASPTGADAAALNGQESTLIQAVEDQFTVDAPELWNVFEPSLCSDASGVSTLRFSYGFPRRSADDAERLTAAMARPFGTKAVAAATKLSRALTHPVTQQVMFGYARGAGNQAARVKLYLMMKDGETTAALDLARQIVGYDGPLSSEGLPLHALGIDVGESGLVGAKLYFHRESATAEEGAAWFGVPSPLRNVLLIHRLRGPSDPAALQPSEVDVAPADCGLTWSDFRQARPVHTHEAALAALDGLAAQFAVDVRRVTVGVAPAAKLTVYYLIR